MMIVWIKGIARSTQNIMTEKSWESAESRVPCYNSCTYILHTLRLFNKLCWTCVRTGLGCTVLSPTPMFSVSPYNICSGSAWSQSMHSAWQENHFLNEVSVLVKAGLLRMPENFIGSAPLMDNYTGKASDRRNSVMPLKFSISYLKPWSSLDCQSGWNSALWCPPKQSCTLNRLRKVQLCLGWHLGLPALG